MKRMISGLKRSRPAAAAVLAMSLVAAGCANFPSNIQPGMTRAEVLARFGAPAVDRRTGAGEFLIYSTQPLGNQAFGALLDPSGHVIRVEQLLTLPNFGRIEAGRWTEDDVLGHYGPPADHRILGGHLAWDYRYFEMNVYHSLFTVTFDENGVVLKTENGPDPLYDPNIK